MPDTLSPPRSNAPTATEASYLASTFTPAHPDLANAAGVPALLANEAYVESLTRIVYYWGYPAVDGFGRTSGWELMKDGAGATMDSSPAHRKTIWVISTTTCRRPSAR